MEHGMLQVTPLHDGWTFARSDQQSGSKYGFSTIDRLSAEVPGHVHLDLQRHGIIPDPHQMAHEQGLEWIDHSDWNYQTTFHWTPNPDLPRRVLRFEGLDTVCDILLNDKVVLCCDNMFTPVEVDVTDLLLVGENRLQIEFASAVKIGLKREKRYLDIEKLPDNVARFPERSFVRKVQCMYGWDWGPRLVSCGIWRPVSLVEYAARIQDLWVRQEHAEDGAVTLILTPEIEGEGTLSAELWLDDEWVGDFEADGQGRYVFVVEEPALWSLESPNLYTINAALERDEQAVDERSVTVGLRQVRLLREKDALGESYEFELNGERLWIRGSNWIPDFSFPSAIDRAQLRRRIEAAKQMGQNMLRVWGGGLYESDDFYDICDELGMLVWQDFPFACAYYPEDDLTADSVRTEATANIKRLRNRACLALWCGNNENLQMWDYAWQGMDRRPPRYYGARYYRDILPKLLVELDPERSYVESSPVGADPDGDNRCNDNGYGDQHYWDVWHGRGDWKHYADSKTRFSSEFGFSASCSLKAWRYVLGRQDVSDVDPRSHVVKWHDKTGKGYETYLGYVHLHYPEIKTLEDLVYYSQLNQRDALRFGIEHYRRGVFCRGTLVWQLNDIWPVQSWALIDSLGEWKAAAHELVRLYDDVVLSLDRQGSVVSLYGANDGREEVDDLVMLQARSTLDGDLLRESTLGFRLAPGERRKLGELDVAGLPAPETLVVAATSSSDVWRLVSEPKEARFETPEIVAHVVDEGVLAIRTDRPVVDLMLWDEASDVRFLDNFLTFPGAGIRYCSIEGTPKALHGRSLAGHHRIPLSRTPLD